MKVVDCAINIKSNYVYVGISSPFVLIMLKGLDGSLLQSKIMYCTGLVQCTTGTHILVSNILYVPLADRVVIFYQDFNKKDYYTAVNANDI